MAGFSNLDAQEKCVRAGGGYSGIFGNPIPTGDSSASGFDKSSELLNPPSPPTALSFYAYSVRSLLLYHSDWLIALEDLPLIMVNKFKCATIT